MRVFRHIKLSSFEGRRSRGMIVIEISLLIREAALSNMPVNEMNQGRERMNG